ncbi:MAG: tetratricopeptide repeat protein [Acetobacteraceae bacterium]|nr:tetratricopeptide repeat protein [Acetobacteraceae bacterium]
MAQLQGRRTHGQTCCFLGEFVVARALLEQCAGLSDPAHRTVEGLSFDYYTLTLSWLAVTLTYLGYIDQARSRINTALSEARRLKHTHTLAHILDFANWIDWVTCSPAVHIEEALALPTEHGFSLFRGWAIASRGWTLTTLGQAREGIASLTHGLVTIRATGAVANLPLLLIGLAEAYAMVGQPVEGLKYLAEAAEIIETSEERLDEAELHRVRGDLLNATGDRSAAEQAYRQTLAVSHRQSAKLWELRASISLARLLRDQGRLSEARDLLAPVYGWFTEGFGTKDLREARALLDELS